MKNTFHYSQQQQQGLRNRTLPMTQVPDGTVDDSGNNVNNSWMDDNIQFITRQDDEKEKSVLFSEFSLYYSSDLKQFTWLF